MFSNEEINKGIEIVRLDKDLYNRIKNYEFTDKDKESKYITCLDNFSLYSEAEWRRENANISSMIHIDSNFKFDLEKIIHTGSCYGLGIYIYELIDVIKQK